MNFLHRLYSYVKSRVAFLRRAHQAGGVPHHEIAEQLMVERSYDPGLLERITLRWQFGDWESLVQVREEELAAHPRKDVIALYIGSAYMQLGDLEAGRRYVGMASNWGCKRELMNRVLISGVYSSLGSAAFIAGNQSSETILKHFENSIRVGAPYCDPELLSQARLGVQRKRLDQDAAESRR